MTSHSIIYISLNIYNVFSIHKYMHVIRGNTIQQGCSLLNQVVPGSWSSHRRRSTAGWLSQTRLEGECSQMRYSLTLRIALSTRIRSLAIACVFRASSSVNCAVVRDKLISIISVSASVHVKHLSAYLNGHSFNLKCSFLSCLPVILKGGTV